MPPGTEKITEMTKGSGKIWGIMALTLVSLLFLLVPFSLAAIKFKFITCIYGDGQGVALNQPEGVACNDQDLLIGADTGNGRLLKYIFRDGAVETGTVEKKNSPTILSHKGGIELKK